MATATETTKTDNKSTRTAVSGLTLETERGVTTIADDVVAKLAGHSCREIEGVAALGTTFRRLLSRARPGQESLTQGVNVEVGKKEAAIDVVLIVEYGYSIPSLAQEVRDNVIATVESGTGLIVKEVNIEVDDLRFPDEAPASSRVE
jgi:uncharacterized alkaline shock family protein YloU